jgi:hypothetical protein
VKGVADASHKFTSLFSLNNNQVSSLRGLQILIYARNFTSTGNKNKNSELQRKET